MPLSDMLPDFEDALDAEIATARQQGGVRYHLTQGMDLGPMGRGFAYRFRLTRPCSIPDDAGVGIQAGQQRVEGNVVSVDEQDIVLLLDERLEDLRQATMTVNLWYILECLRARLGHPTRLASRTFDGAGPTVQAPPPGYPSEAHLPELAGLNAEQRHAIAAGRQAGVRFIWGPPGTGKTRTIAALAALAAAAGDRVLLLAISNDALDVATLATLDAAVRYAPQAPLGRAGQIIRLGTARHPEVVSHATVTPIAALRIVEPSLTTQYDQLRAEQQALRAQSHPSPNRLETVRAALRVVRQALREREDRFARDAQVVLCTLARLATADAIDDVRFDTVIVDEASMASIPYAAFASTFAQRTVIYAGDFRQLPPVVQSREPSAERWLTRNVFDHAGIPDRLARQGSDDPRMVMLAEQYRMTRTLADRVSRVFYGGRLRTAAVVTDQSRDGAAFVDIADLWPYCQREPQHLGHSRFNVVSALISLGLARRAAHEIGGTVGIVTPFNAQATLMRALARDLGLSRLRISTVHRFQGDEVDVMILDLTTARGHSKPGFLLGGDVWSTAGRLLNVAISRARHALLIVGDWSHLERYWLSLGAKHRSEALFRVLDGITRHRLRPDDVRNHQGELVLPELPDAIMGASAPSPRWPVWLHDGSLHHARASHSVGSARQQLLLAVRPGQGPADWVTRSENQGAAITIRGRDLAPGWEQRFASQIVLPYPAPCDAAVMDGERFAITLRSRHADGARTVLVTSPSAASLIATLTGVVPTGVRLIRPQPMMVPDDLPPDPDGVIPLVPVIDPPDPEPTSAVAAELTMPDAPSICPISHHRLKVMLIASPMRLRCVESACSFNDDEESVSDAEGGRALTDAEAVGLLQRAAPVYVQGTATEAALCCNTHGVAPRVRRVPVRGLVLECTAPGCFGWRREYATLPDALLVP